MVPTMATKLESRIIADISGGRGNGAGGMTPVYPSAYCQSKPDWTCGEWKGLAEEGKA